MNIVTWVGLRLSIRVHIEHIHIYFIHLWVLLLNITLSQKDSLWATCVALWWCDWWNDVKWTLWKHLIRQTYCLLCLFFFLVPFTVLFLLCVVSKRSFRILVYSHSNLILSNQHHAHSPNAKYEKDKWTSWKWTKIMRSGRISRNRLNDFQLLSSNILNHYGDDSANKMKWKFIQ